MKKTRDTTIKISLEATILFYIIGVILLIMQQWILGGLAILYAETNYLSAKALRIQILLEDLKKQSQKSFKKKRRKSS